MLLIHLLSFLFAVVDAREGISHKCPQLYSKEMEIIDQYIIISISFHASTPTRIYLEENLMAIFQYFDACKSIMCETSNQKYAVYLYFVTSYMKTAKV